MTGPTLDQTLGEALALGMLTWDEAAAVRPRLARSYEAWTEGDPDIPVHRDQAQRWLAHHLRRIRTDPNQPSTTTRGLMHTRHRDDDPR